MKGLHQVTGDLIEVDYWTNAEHYHTLLLLEGAEVTHNSHIYSFPVKMFKGAMCCYEAT